MRFLEEKHNVRVIFHVYELLPIVMIYFGLWTELFIEENKSLKIQKGCTVINNCAKLSQHYHPIKLKTLTLCVIWLTHIILRLIKQESICDCRAPEDISKASWFLTFKWRTQCYSYFIYTPQWIILLSSYII